VKGIEPRPEFTELLQNRFGVTEFPDDAPPLVDIGRHLELGRVLKEERGFKIFVYVVASHWLEKPGTPANPEHYQVAYGLRTPGPGTELATWRVRVEMGEQLETLAHLFAGADWQEREQYDLVGVVFKNHPDLRRLMMPDDWQGHPLRKDYAIETACPPWR
jgi:NADH-quinone oxidoreductase subunit C